MGVKFGDLYEEMVTLEEAISRMRVDIENADCDSVTKCRLRIEVEYLEQQAYELSRTNFSFDNLNFVTVMESIERCMHCIDFEGDFSDLSPKPVAVASSCGGKKTRLSLTDVESLSVYEVTGGKATKHEFVRSAMPYTFETTAGEKYVVTYDSLRKGFSVKGFYTKKDKSVYLYGNISKVVAKLSEPASKKYKKDSVQACKVLLTTPTPMRSSRPLSNAVNSSSTSSPSVAKTSETEVEMVFQVYV